MRPPVARKLRTPALDSPIGPRVRYRLLWLPLLYTQAEYHCYRTYMHAVRSRLGSVVSRFLQRMSWLR
ncbi:hypothetical protein T4D_9862 [Trichinella pseudospiralis]|uniref:Uncharacterized protein n=1 Tax=Trichinella pseudospiralis TaxID=6337 RepID=A0A0V1F9Z5_TRIPS|nr:hypothetical protein T4D_9862 [Trichinella pseudospiralis]